MTNHSASFLRLIVRIWLSHQPRLKGIVNPNRVPLSALRQLLVADLNHFVSRHVDARHSHRKCIWLFIAMNGLPSKLRTFRLLLSLY